MTEQSRQPKGTPAGGQFLASTRTEAAVALIADLNEEFAGDRPDYPWSPRVTTHSKVGETCPDCHTIHGGDAAVAVDRFAEGGPSGYRSRLGGEMHATREEAVGDYCAAVQATRSPDAVALLDADDPRDAAGRPEPTMEDLLGPLTDCPRCGETLMGDPTVTDGGLVHVADSGNPDYGRDCRPAGAPDLDYAFDDRSVPDFTAQVDQAIATAQANLPIQKQVTKPEFWCGYTVLYHPTIGRCAVYSDDAWEQPTGEQPVLPWTAPTGVPVARVDVYGDVTERIDDRGSAAAAEERNEPVCNDCGRTISDTPAREECEDWHTPGEWIPEEYGR